MELIRRNPSPESTAPPVADLTPGEREMLSVGSTHTPRYCEDLDGLPLSQAYSALQDKLDESQLSGFVYNGMGVTIYDGSILKSMNDIEKMQRLLAACGSFHMLPGQ